MPGRRTALGAAIVGCALFVVACALPAIGLFRGRMGGTLFQLYGDRVLSGQIPYRDFSLVYPPGALPAFIVPSFGRAGDYDSWFMAFEAACGLACVVVVALVTRSRVAAAFCALAPLALGPLTLHRYDLWPTAFAVAGLAAVLLGRPRTGFAALGAGTAAKIFPAVLLPLTLVYVGRRTAERAGWWFVAALLAIVGPFLVLGPGGVRFSVEQQMGRALQIESMGSSALLVAHAIGGYTPRAGFGRGSWNLYGGLPDAVAALETALQLAGVFLVWWLYARGPRTRERLVLAATAAVAVWLAFGKVLSPQFLIWLVPLVALLGIGRDAVLLLASLGLTQAFYPGRYDALVDFHALPIALLAARNAVLLLLAASLLWQLQRERVVQEVGRERERGHPGHAILLDGGERNGPDRVPGLQPGRGHD